MAPLAGQPTIDMVMPATALPNGDPRPADLIYPNGRLFQIVEQPGTKGLFLGYLITAGGEYELIRTPYDAPEIQLSQTLTYLGDQFQSSRYPIFLETQFP